MDIITIDHNEENVLKSDTFLYSVNRRKTIYKVRMHKQELIALLFIKIFSGQINHVK